MKYCIIAQNERPLFCRHSQISTIARPQSRSFVLLPSWGHNNGPSHFTLFSQNKLCQNHATPARDPRRLKLRTMKYHPYALALYPVRVLIRSHDGKKQQSCGSALFRQSTQPLSTNAIPLTCICFLPQIHIPCEGVMH